MVRTVVSLEEDDKDWLDRKAAEEGIPMTELIRRAVRLLRSENRHPQMRSRDELLEVTAGLWKKGDGLDYLERLRGQW